MVHVPASRAAAAGACSGSSGCTEGGSICNRMGEQGHPFLSHTAPATYCSHPLSGGVRGKGDPGKPLTGCCAAARQSSASTPSLPECARRLPPVDVSLQLADRTRGAPHEGAKVSHDGALWSPGHCMNNPFPHQRFRLSAFLFSIVSTPWLLPSSQDWDEAACAGITSSSQW